MKTCVSNLSENFIVFPLFLKVGNTISKTSLNSNTDIDTDQDDKKENYLICKTCENKITTLNDKADIFGSFQHSFLNPAGHIFEIGCFTKAIGCTIIGIPTGEWTWFPNYQWQIAICDNCSSHLGWFYSTDNEPSFFGLILNTLI